MCSLKYRKRRRWYLINSTASERSNGDSEEVDDSDGFARVVQKRQTLFGSALVIAAFGKGGKLEG